MKNKNRCRRGARVCAIVLSAVLLLLPAMAQAMTLSVNYDSGTLAVHGTGLPAGLENASISVKVTDAKSNVVLNKTVQSNDSGAFYGQFGPNDMTLTPNSTYKVVARGETADKATEDEAQREFTTPGAVGIVLYVPQPDTATQSATVSGTAQSGERVTVSLSGTGSASQTVIAGGNGTFSAVFSGLAYGSYSVSAQYENASVGGQGASASFDLTAPAPVIAPLTAQGTGGVNTATVSGTAEPGASISATLNGDTQTATADTNGSYSISFTNVAAGTHTVQVSDNHGQSATAQVTVTDVPSPSVAALTVQATGGVKSATVSGTAEPGATINVTVGNVAQSTTADASGKYSISFTNVAAGTHNVQVSDNYGQTVSAQVLVTDVPVIITQKDIAVTAVIPSTEMVTVQGQASAYAQVKVSGFGKTFNVTTDASGNFTCTLTNVAPGTYNSLAVEYVDTATYTGKSASVSGSWTVLQAQVTANITLTGVTGGVGTIQVTGTAKAGEKLAVLCKNQSTAAEVAIAATADANGNFTQSLSGLAAGTYTVTVSYQNQSVGASASRAGVVVTAGQAVKAGIILDKLYESSLTVVGKTSANCNVTVKVNYNNRDVTISRTSGSDGVFRIPLPRTLPKHTEVLATVTYADGTTESATGHVYAGSADQEYRKTYKVGSVGSDVYDIEWRLQQLGYPISPDRVYDQTTASVVRSFQYNNGLSVDGMAGPNTLKKLYSVTAVGYNSSGGGSGTDYIYLDRNSRGTLVSNVQTRLKELGYYTIRVDGIYGSGTQGAVRAFQRNNGLPVTGVVNTDTYNAMMASNAVGVGGSVSGDYVELSRGNRGVAVVRLQTRLQYLGYYTISVDGIYGSGTQTAVRRFQSRNGISANGVATVYTQQVLFSSSAIANSSSGSSTSTGYVYLHYGSNGAAVRRLQQALKNAGYYSGAIDGQYYDQTYAAVKAFQRSAGLGVDGIAGRKTQNALYGTNY